MPFDEFMLRKKAGKCEFPLWKIAKIIAGICEYAILIYVNFDACKSKTPQWETIITATLIKLH